ncbi:hypothetical protein D3C80_748710 [compost metagenome]
MGTPRRFQRLIRLAQCLVGSDIGKQATELPLMRGQNQVCLAILKGIEQDGRIIPERGYAVCIQHKRAVFQRQHEVAGAAADAKAGTKNKGRQFGALQPIAQFCVGIDLFQHHGRKLRSIGRHRVFR